jgi:D-arginine dehydrogenase
MAVTPLEVDCVIIGAGIAGASLGYFLAPHAKIVVLEREPQPGYHSTGRSAAMVIDSYGSAQVRALTVASRCFFDNPPAQFTATPLLQPRAVMMFAGPEQSGLLSEHFEIVRRMTPRATWLSAEEALGLVPVLRREALVGAVIDPTAADIDVNALHQGFLRGIRAYGGSVRTHAHVTAITYSAGTWRVRTDTQEHRAAVLINAAGAWCDQIACLAEVRPTGLVPKRRSAFLFRPSVARQIHEWPMCGPIDESWYMKPDAGMLLGSPANADPTEPHDVQPEELDVAIGISNIEAATTLQITRPTRTWAGLRSFVSDGDLVGGYDAYAPGFFWLTGQGGYGIQTSPAMGEACASLVLRRPLPERLAAQGITQEQLSPARLRTERPPG